jgi:hypothetical protein
METKGTAWLLVGWLTGFSLWAGSFENAKLRVGGGLTQYGFVLYLLTV